MQFRFPEDERFAQWKIVFFQYFAAAIFIILLGGYWRIQIGRHRQYLDQSERNRIRDLPVIAPRGRILDREGRVLVDNTPSFSVLLMREGPARLSPDQVEGIARGLQMDPQDLQDLLENSAHLPRFQPIVLKQSAGIADAAFVESHANEYPDLALIQVPERLYPYQTVASGVLGYLGEVSEDTIARPGSPYRPGDVVGKSGIEASYDSVLAGQDGTERVVVNSKGQQVGTLGTINATRGHDLRLTLDLDLQTAAENALGDHPGAIVALDPRTGEVLAMVSHPGFDPNEFARRIDPKEWLQLTTDPQKPLMNKAIQAQLAPGSIFKIFMAAAALETGAITPSFTVHCAGEVTIYGHTFHDWVWWEKRAGHGLVDLHRAIVVSCDVFFYTLGKMLGIDTIDKYATGLGLGSRTGIDLPSESSGLIPSPAWVEKVFKHPWWAGETISVAIGQGAVEVTPIQLAYALGGIASGGIFERPHLVFRDEQSPKPAKLEEDRERRFPLKESTVDALTRGMWGVVNEGGGTGVRARDASLDIAGKTGTAQVVSAGLQNASHSASFNNNAWFVGFSPSVNPKIAVVALVMQGAHSAVAVPMVRDVIEAYYAKHPSQKPPQQEMTQARLMNQPAQGPAPAVAKDTAGSEQ